MEFKSRAKVLFLALSFSALFVAACGGSSPTKALDDANRQLTDAAWAEECAGDTYRAAQRMLKEANEANEAGNYDEAKRKAEAASKLAAQAMSDAELNREECLKRKESDDDCA